MGMCVTLRPNGIPDVYVQDAGQSCDLAALDKKIEALKAARAWLAKQGVVKESQSKK